MSTRIAARATTKNAPSPTTMNTPLCTLDRLQPLLVQLDAEAGLVGDVQIAVAVDIEGLCEHEVAVFGNPVRRIVRELDEWAVRDGSGELKVRGQAEAVRPRVR